MPEISDKQTIAGIKATTTQFCVDFSIGEEQVELLPVLLLACEITIQISKALFGGGRAFAGWLRRQNKLQGERDYLRTENKRLKGENDCIYDGGRG
jgi:hypothetical protein